MDGRTRPSRTRHHACVTRDADDCWECCYVLVEDRSADDVAALLGGRLGDRRHREPDAALRSAAWPAIGPARGGWTVLVDPHFEFGDAHDQLREWSRGTRVVCLLVIERELFSHALAWADGELAWQASFEGEVDDRPSVSGQMPVEPDVLARPLGPMDDPRTWYRVPVAAVELVTGWRPARSKPKAQPLFAQVVYPRPLGVAASVARDLAD